MHLTPRKRLRIIEEHNLQAATDSSQELDLGVLPPLLLHFVLPAGYPESEPPEIVSISTSFSWLHRPRNLQVKLLELWVEGEGVLCAWIEYLENGMFFDDLDDLRSGDRDTLRCVNMTHACYSSQLPDVYIQLVAPNTAATQSTPGRAREDCPVVQVRVVGFHLLALLRRVLWCKVLSDPKLRACVLPRLS